MAQVQSVRAINQKKKKQEFITYGMDQVFSPLIYGPSAKCAGHTPVNQREKRGFITYSMHQENEVSN